LFFSYSCLSTPGKNFGVSSTEKDAWYYNMHHTKRGKAIIFNHEHFQVDNKNLEPRAGTEMDCRNLEVSLNNLGFSVTPYENLTLDELNVKIDYCMYAYYINLSLPIHNIILITFLLIL